MQGHCLWLKKAESFSIHEVTSVLSKSRLYGFYLSA